MQPCVRVRALVLKPRLPHALASIADARRHAPLAKPASSVLARTLVHGTDDEILVFLYSFIEHALAILWYCIAS